MKAKRMATLLSLLLSMALLLSACGTASSGAGTTAPATTTTTTTENSAPSGNSSESQGGGAVLSAETELTHTVAPWQGGEIDIYTTSATDTFAKKTPEDTIVIGDTNGIFPCDPAVSTDYAYAYNLYESLLRFDAVTGEVSPLLATEWGYDDDGNFHIKLREGVKFHDGTTMDAEDVLYTFQRLADPIYSPKVSSVFKLIDFDKSYAEDDYNIVIVFTAPSGAFVNYLCTGFTGILSKDFMEENGADYGFMEADAGCGPYKLVETVTGLSYTFERFDDYWGEPGTVKTIIYRCYKDQSTMFIDYENGDIDIAINNNYDAANRILNGECSDTRMICTLMPRTNSMYLQSIAAPLDDIRVRQAIAYAIDAEACMIAAYGSELMGRVATSILPDGMQFKVASGINEYNPDKALELLAEAGYDEKNPCSVVMETPNINTNMTLFEAVQGYLREVGIECELVIEEQTTSLGRQNEATGDPQFDILQNMTPLPTSDPDEYLSYRAAYGRELGTFSDVRGIQDQRISELIALGSVTLDAAERAEIYEELQQLIREGAYIIPLVQPICSIAMRTYLDGIELWGARNFMYSKLMIVGN